MPRKSQLLIRAAVMNCLARCAESTAPLCCLGEFLEQLATLGWRSEDVIAVERAVLKVLGRLQEKSFEGEIDFPTAAPDEAPKAPEKPFF